MSPELQRARPDHAIITALAISAIVIGGGAIRAKNGIPIQEIPSLDTPGLMEDYLAVLCEARAIQARALEVSEGKTTLDSDLRLAANERREISDLAQVALGQFQKEPTPKNEANIAATLTAWDETIGEEMALALARDVMPPQALQLEIDRTRGRMDELIRKQGLIPTQIADCNSSANARRNDKGQWKVEKPTHNRTGVKRKYLAFGREKVDFQTAMRGRQ